MKYFYWNEQKNKLLKKIRNISFEEILLSISQYKLIEVIEHPNKNKYPYQKMFIVEVREYIYIVPFIEEEDRYYLKTIYPSRAATKKFLGKGEWKWII